MARETKVFACAVALVSMICAVSVAQATASAERAYLADYDNGNIVGINTGTDTLLPNPFVTGFGSIQQPQISPDGKLLFVPNFGTDQVLVINLATNSVKQTLFTDDKPVTVGFSPDSRFAYVLNQGSRTVQKFNVDSGSQASVPASVGVEPHSLVLSPDGKYIYVAAKGDGEITVIDTATMQQDGVPIPVDPQPFYLAISPDGKRLYFTDGYDQGYVRVVDTVSRQLVAESMVQAVNGKVQDVAISPDGTQGWMVASEDDQIIYFDPRSMEQIGDPLAVGDYPNHVSLTPDGRKAYVANYNSGGITVIDTAIQGFYSPIAYGTGPTQVVVVPNQPPRAELTGTVGARAGEPVTFTPGGTEDADGSIARYDWNFGDGGKVTTGSDLLTLTHVYKKPGTYNATLTATDDEGCSTTYVATTETAFCNGSDQAQADLRLKIAPADNRFKFGKARLNRRKGFAALTVKLPGPGKVRLTGKGIKGVKRSVKKPGWLSLAVRTKGNAKRRLSRKGKLTVRAKVRFTPRFGKPRTKVRAVTLRKR